jgi:peptidoglycan/xylan/chitin deacetylase (PgdA/CDA1 family)
MTPPSRYDRDTSPFEWGGSLKILLVLFLLMLGLGPAQARPSGQRFVSIAFHEVVDDPAGLETDAVTTKGLAQFFDWLKGTGWTAVSLDDLAAAHRGTRPLPDKAILITFDDGYKSLYTRVFPLLRIYRFPIVSALVGSWMEGESGTVMYGDRKVPRSTFISWAEAREMQASGLVEFGSHSYALHQGVQANPQGNMIPAAVTWRYDPATGHYETDAEYRNRIRADLQRSRAQMAANLGRAPRAMVWPYGRYSGPALEVTKQLGFSFALTLEPEPAFTGDLFAIHRYFPSLNPGLGDIAFNLRFEPGRPTTRRIACLKIDALAAQPIGPAQDEVLGRLVEGLRSLGTNTVVIDANAPLAPGAPLGGVYFPTPLRPLAADVLSRATWQIRTRGGSDVFLRLPIEAAAAAVGEARVPELFGDMMRYTTPDGVMIDMPPLAPTPIVPALRGDIRARRAALDPAAFEGRVRLGLAAFRAASFIDPRQRLMIGLAEPTGPPDWADVGLLPQSRSVADTAALAGRLGSEGWLRPDVAGRVALTLPAAPDQRPEQRAGQQVEALRQAQRQGVSAFALCPEPPLPPALALSAAFSASTFPYKP